MKHNCEFKIAIDKIKAAKAIANRKWRKDHPEYETNPERRKYKRKWLDGKLAERKGLTSVLKDAII